MINNTTTKQHHLFASSHHKFNLKSKKKKERRRQVAHCGGSCNPEQSCKQCVVSVVFKCVRQTSSFLIFCVLFLLHMIILDQYTRKISFLNTHKQHKAKRAKNLTSSDHHTTNSSLCCHDEERFGQDVRWWQKEQLHVKPTF